MENQSLINLFLNFLFFLFFQINKIIMPPRPGDISSIRCEIENARKNLNWTPKYGIEDICVHLNNWYIRSPNGYIN